MGPHQPKRPRRTRRAGSWSRNRLSLEGRDGPPGTRRPNGANRLMCARYPGSGIPEPLASVPLRAGLGSPTFPPGEPSTVMVFRPRAPAAGAGPVAQVAAEVPPGSPRRPCTVSLMDPADGEQDGGPPIGTRDAAFRPPPDRGMCTFSIHRAWWTRRASCPPTRCRARGTCSSVLRPGRGAPAGDGGRVSTGKARLTDVLASRSMLCNAHSTVG
jgi:hypothetical protein